MIRHWPRIAEKAWRWWLSEFLALLPQAFLKSLVSSRLTLLLRPSEAITEIAVMASEKRVLQETIPADASEKEFRHLRDVIGAATRRKRFDVIGIIPKGQCLARPLTLPLAAEAHLDEAVRYQIERVSPFKADNTLYDIKQLEGNRAANELRLKLSIVSKASVAELEKRTANLGFRIDHFAIEAPDGGALETLAFKSDLTSRTKMPLEAKAFLAAAFLLAVSLALAPVAGKWQHAKALEREVSILKPKAEQVLKLQSERDKILARRAQMIGLKKAALPPVAILSRLSELLDDQTFLFDMRMDRGAITISGLSIDASKLAQRLGTIEVFKSVKFSGPVTRDVQSARDRFTLILEMAASS
jgi:general secretion pathway protein L